jgi:hypothetical protein
MTATVAMMASMAAIAAIKIHALATAEVLFWSSCLLLAYVVAVFPVLVWARARCFPRPHAAAEVTPRASVIVVAHNEEDAIGAKLESLLALDYPRDRLEVLVASDGSIDGTEAIVRAHEGRGIRLLAFPRLGKAAALNAAAAAAVGEVLVFSDANGLLERGALKALMRPFADPGVGGVAGNQVYRRPERDRGVGGGELAYWSLSSAGRAPRGASFRPPARSTPFGVSSFSRCPMASPTTSSSPPGSSLRNIVSSSLPKPKSGSRSEHRVTVSMRSR